MLQIKWLICFTTCLSSLSSTLSSTDHIVVVMLSQHYHSHHSKPPALIVQQWKDNLKHVPDMQDVITFVESWRHFKTTEIHMIVPMLPRLLAEYGSLAKWFLFVTGDTDINFAILQKFIGEHHHHHQENNGPMDIGTMDDGTMDDGTMDNGTMDNKAIWLGYSLQDQQPSIMHHFADTVNNPLAFPLLCSGFMLSVQLLHRNIDNPLGYALRHAQQKGDIERWVNKCTVVPCLFGNNVMLLIVNKDSRLSPLCITSYYFILPHIVSYYITIGCAPHVASFNPSFTIDPSYEMAQFFKYLRYPSVSELHPLPPVMSDEGALLTNSSYFCPAHSTHPHCLTMCRTGEIHNDTPAKGSDVLIAVKTCHKNHNKRLDILQQTWATDAVEIRYYSDVADATYNTIDTGVPNTERGHCTKLLTIINMAMSTKEFDWLVVADDDTLLSIPRLLHLLGQHDSTVPIVLGDIYGYELYRNHGYLYPTGGAGIGISRVAAEMIVLSGITCPSHDYPDDMFLGIIVKQLNITITHIPQLHQDQPQSYHPTVLASQAPPISFHHFNPLDPVSIYNKYLVPLGYHGSTMQYSDHGDRDNDNTGKQEL